MDITKAEIFWGAFAEHLRSRLAAMPNWIEKYGNRTRWTQTLTEIVNAFGLEHGYQENGEVANEYFRVDIVFSKWVRDQDPYAWDLDVAIELENDPRSWFDEVTKLHHLNCGLRVIMTYQDYDDPAESLLSKVDRAVRLLKTRKYPAHSGEWLLIIGPYNWQNQTPFRAFRIHNHAAEELPEYKIFP